MEQIDLEAWRNGLYVPRRDLNGTGDYRGDQCTRSVLGVGRGANDEGKAL